MMLPTRHLENRLGAVFEWRVCDRCVLLSGLESVDGDDFSRTVPVHPDSVLLLSNLERHCKIQRQLPIVNPVQTWRRAKLLVQKIHQAAIDEQLLPDQRHQVR